MRLLVTGGAGFIGSNFIHHILQEHPQWEVTNLDKLTYAGNLENLKDIENLPHYRFVKGDIADRDLVDSLFSRGVDAVINFAAESHVDRSILDPSPFIDTNIKGTQVLLEGAQKYQVEKFLHVSTDEVYGSIERGNIHGAVPALSQQPLRRQQSSRRAPVPGLLYYSPHPGGHHPVQQ